MKVPFGPYKGMELDQAPDGLLRWIDVTYKAEPGKGTPPDLRDQFRMDNQQLKAEARRILRERRRNGVTVKEPFDKDRARTRRKTGSERAMAHDE